MPKRGRDFPDTVNFGCPPDTRLTLIALSYLRGHGGNYAAVAREFLLSGMRSEMDSLDERKRKDFEEILENIKLRESV